MSIEDIILDHDNRGISALRPHIPKAFCEQAASLILDHPRNAVIVTGFYILTARAPETDGPPGAIAVGEALQSLGYSVTYVTDRYTVPLMTAMGGSTARVVDFPITDDEASKKFAADLLSQLNPSVLIAVERCGVTSEGLYRNMKGLDITQYNASTDHLFHDHPNTVGVGDGGNEIGMGNVATIVPTIPSLVKMPCVTPTTKLIISSVSNWGGYGLVAALSKLAGRNLLPSVQAEQDLIKRMVDMGAVDGITTKSEYLVDSFTLEENGRIVARLHEFLAQQGVSS